MSTPRLTAVAAAGLPVERGLSPPPTSPLSARRTESGTLEDGGSGWKAREDISP